VACDHVIEAPDHMRGHELACPSCEATNVLHSPGDEARSERAEEDSRKEERERFLRGLARARGQARPPSATWSAFVAPVEGNPDRSLSLQAAQRLKDISVYLVGFAYLLLLIPILLGGVVAMGTGWSVSWKAFALLGCALAGVFSFVFLKFMSDAVRAVADLTELGRSIESRLQLLTEGLGREQAESQQEGSEGG
jgi:hypothetical protein